MSTLETTQHYWRGTKGTIEGRKGTKHATTMGPRGNQQSEQRTISSASDSHTPRRQKQLQGGQQEVMCGRAKYPQILVNTRLGNFDQHATQKFPLALVNTPSSQILVSKIQKFPLDSVTPSSEISIKIRFRIFLRLRSPRKNPLNLLTSF